MRINVTKIYSWNSSIRKIRYSFTESTEYLEIASVTDDVHHDLFSKEKTQN